MDPGGLYRVVIASCCAVLVVGTAHVAFGQPASPSPADAAFDEGVRLYDLQDWDAAIAKFKEAYRLRAEPRSLFDIAQSYRLKGDCAEAQSFYKTYRRNYPDAPNIDKVDKFIADLEACAKSKADRSASPPQTTPTPPAPPSPTNATNIQREPHRDLTGVLVFGAGAVVLGGAAAGFELWGESTYDRAKHATDQPSQTSLYHSANTKRYIADGLAVAGIGSAAVALWLVFRTDDSTPEPTVGRRIVVTPNGLAVTGAF